MADAATSGMKPCLRSGVFWVPTADGAVYAVAPRGRFVVPGADTHRWLERLAPFFDGTHTLEELAGRLTAEQRDKVEELVRRLHRHGMLDDLAGGQPPTLTLAERRTYAEQLSYLAQYTDGAAHRFQRYRGTRALLVGAGPALLALLAATLRSGVRRVTVAVTGEHDTDRTRVGELLGAAEQVDSEQKCVIQDLDPVHGGSVLSRLIADADVVLHLTGPTDDAARASRALAVDRLCADHGKVLSQALVDGGEAWLCPVGTPGTADAPVVPEARWEAVWRRLRTAGADGPVGAPDGPAAPLDDAAAEVLANLLVVRCLRHLTGIDAGDRRTAVRLDLAQLTTSSHAVLAHPRAVPATADSLARFRARIADRRSGPAQDELGFSRAAAGCVDARLGILTMLDERHFQQLPLWVTQVSVADPVGLLRARGAPTVTHGAAFEFADARHRAARQGLELYASAMLDRRRLVAADANPLSSDAAPEAGWLWGWRLDGGGERLVPANAVFAVGPPADELEPAAPVPAGVASGSTWAAAVATGLLRRCAGITVADALAAARPFPAVDLDRMPLDEEGQRLLGILRGVGAPVTAYDITGGLGLPTYSLYLADRPVSHATGWTAGEALRDGLHSVLLAHQAHICGQPEYDPLPVPAVPERLRGRRSEAPPPRPEPARDELAAGVVRALTARGGTPVAVPLDHDPALDAVLPYAVRVVIATCPWVTA